MLKKSGAVVENSHFVYASGKHGDVYVNKDKLFLYPDYISKISKGLSDLYSEPIDAVIGPVTGGMILASWTAFHTSKKAGKPIMSVYADKIGNNNFVISRGYDEQIRGKKVLIVEDILTTGSSIKKVIKILKKLNVKIVGVSAIVNRGNVKSTDILDIKVRSLINIDLKSYNPKVCPYCKDGVPINESLGHWKDKTK